MVRRKPQTDDGISDGIGGVVVRFPKPKAPHVRKPLSDRTIAAAKPKARAWKLGDGRGLYLLIKPNGTKLWRYDFRLRGRRRTISLGVYDDVSLSAARERLSAARRLVTNGEDPVAARRSRKRAEASEASFRIVAAEWLSKQTLSPATRRKLGLILTTHLEPTLGDLPISSLTPSLILEAVRPAERRRHLDIAHRAKQLCGQVLRYAVATGRAEYDVTSTLRGALAPVARRHYAAPTTPAAAAALLEAIGTHPSPASRDMLTLLALTFVRPGELRRAEWSEVDLERAVWRIPAAKMKMRIDHLVPLSRQALTILKARPTRTGWVFPSPRDPKRPYSNMAMKQMLGAIGYKPAQITPHGFRAMARTLLDEHLRIAPDVIEVQLAHTVRGPLGATYNRSTYLTERTAMMQTWADFIERLV